MVDKVTSKTTVLNLYAGIGGNRKLWENVKVTAVEIDPEIVAIYRKLFPEDKVVVGDAHKYLLEHYKEFEFIWSSPPCQSHSQIRFNLGVKNRPTKPIYPDMNLYQEIILLQTHTDCKWVVENTRSYYEPLIKPQYVGSHFFWANFHILSFELKDRDHRSGTVESLQQLKQIDLTDFEITGKRQILRNCVEPELGLHVFNCSKTGEQQQLTEAFNV